MRSIFAIWLMSLILYANVDPNEATKGKGKGTKVIVVTTHHGGAGGWGGGGWGGWGWPGWGGWGHGHGHGHGGWGWGGWDRKKRDVQSSQYYRR